MDVTLTITVRTVWWVPAFCFLFRLIAYPACLFVNTDLLTQWYGKVIATYGLKYSVR